MHPPLNARQIDLAPYPLELGLLTQSRLIIKTTPYGLQQLVGRRPPIPLAGIEDRRKIPPAAFRSAAYYTEH